LKPFSVLKIFWTSHPLDFTARQVKLRSEPRDSANSVRPADHPSFPHSFSGNPSSPLYLPFCDKWRFSFTACAGETKLILPN
jgi:hypothetical protein